MTDCDICQTVERDGWNSTGWTHCRRCHKRWTGANKQHCNVCHETFSSPSAADKHWTRSGHVHPSELDTLVYGEERRCWHLPDSRDHSLGCEISDGTGSGRMRTPRSRI